MANKKHNKGSNPNGENYEDYNQPQYQQSHYQGSYLPCLQWGMGQLNIEALQLWLTAILTDIRKIPSSSQSNELGINLETKLNQIENGISQITNQLNLLSNQSNSLSGEVAQKIDSRMNEFSTRLKNIENFNERLLSREAQAANARQSGVSVVSSTDGDKSPDEVHQSLEQLKDELENQCRLFLRQDLKLNPSNDKEDFEYLSIVIKATVAHYLFQYDMTEMKEISDWMISVFRELSISTEYLDSVRKYFNQGKSPFIDNLVELRKKAIHVTNIIDKTIQYGELVWIDNLDLFTNKNQGYTINLKQSTNNFNSASGIFTVFPGYRILQSNKKWLVYLDPFTSLSKPNSSSAV